MQYNQAEGCGTAQKVAVTAPLMPARGGTVMKRFMAAMVVMMLPVFCISIAEAQLADTPWPMFRHDAQHTAVSAFSGPAVPGLLWSYRGGTQYISGVASSAALGSDGRVYVGFMDNALYCLTSTSTLAWSYATEYHVFSSPLLGSDGRIFVGSEDDNFYALTSAGALSWSYATTDWVKTSPVLTTDGVLYLGSQDNNVYAISSEGALRWSYVTADRVDSSPALSTDGALYIGSDDNTLYSLASAGTLAWSYTTESSVSSSPAVGGNGTIYIGSNDNVLYALGSAGSLAWSYMSGNNMLSSPAIGTDGTIYIGSDDFNLYAVASQGALLWTYGTYAPLQSSPTVGKDGVIYAASMDTNLYALNSNGTVKWTYETGGYMFGSPVIGPQERIYQGTLTEFDSRRNQFLCISKWQPLMNLILNNDAPGAGESLTIDLTVAPIGGAVDAYAGIGFPNGEFQSFVLGKPTQLREGLHPLATKVKGLTDTYSTRLFSIQVPQGAAGIYTVIAGLVPEGMKPTVANTIPEYLDQELLTVH